MVIYLATQNRHKIEELSALLEGRFSVKSIIELGQLEEIPETGTTISENSYQKANFIAHKFGIPCLSDDSGLEVNVLNNEPGVFSARYAGPQKNDQDNMQLLLKKMQNQLDRSARFLTVLTFHFEGKYFQFEGAIEGKIIHEPRGASGFGYDPIFVPNGYAETFAEMTLQQKNAIAHRAIALKKFIEFVDETTNFLHQ